MIQNIKIIRWKRKWGQWKIKPKKERRKL